MYLSAWNLWPWVNNPKSVALLGQRRRLKSNIDHASKCVERDRSTWAGWTGGDRGILSRFSMLVTLLTM